jgi:hypothetical protein
VYVFHGALDPLTISECDHIRSRIGSLSFIVSIYLTGLLSCRPSAHWLSIPLSCRSNPAIVLPTSLTACCYHSTVGKLRRPPFYYTRRQHFSFEDHHRGIILQMFRAAIDTLTVVAGAIQWRQMWFSVSSRLGWSWFNGISQPGDYICMKGILLL